MTYSADFVGLCLKQIGDRYIFGAEVNLNDENPTAFDCSELVQWAAHRVGVVPEFPDGSWAQEAACKHANMLIPIARAIDTQGALLFRHRGSDGHVAVSLGNGSTIEARGRAYGVNVFNATGRDWTAAGLIPGLIYEPSAPPPPTNLYPPWPGRYLMSPPAMRGNDVRLWQEHMKQRGWKLGVDGVYGPASKEACLKFQKEKGLKIDGVVGPDTWKATWAAPVT